MNPKDVTEGILYGNYVVYKLHLLFLTTNGRTIRLKLTKFQPYFGYFSPQAA